MDKRLFADFYHRNLPSDMESAITLFSIFGGLEISIDSDADLHTLLDQHILQPFNNLREPILSPLMGDSLYIRLLHAISIGDRRLDSAFRRARIGKVRGKEAFEYLRYYGYLSLERSREIPPIRIHPKQRFKREIERHKISHKLRFSTPYLRFWFAFVEPFSKQIQKGDYEAFYNHFDSRFSAFIGFTFEALCDLYLHDILCEKFNDSLLDSGSYWDREVEIDLLSETYNGETWVGECKWTNHKINKKELHKLEEKCHRINLVPDKIILFTKRGFSNELSHLQNNKLILVCAEELEALTRRF